MNQKQTYSVQFYDYLNKSGKSLIDLPEQLQDMISKFEQAKQSWDKAEAAIQEDLFDALLQSDAYISSLIVHTEPDTNTEKVDKLKLMAFKARALQVKWKLSNPNN